jgi:hypothetical protein
MSHRGSIPYPECLSYQTKAEIIDIYKEILQVSLKICWQVPRLTRFYEVNRQGSTARDESMINSTWQDLRKKKKVEHHIWFRPSR